MKALTVDDNPMTGILLADVLAGLGFEPLVAEGAEAALVIFDREQPALCILDWMMPQCDGLELACEIRQRPGGESSYIVMLSSKADVESANRAYEFGVDEFIAKPVAPEQLKARLRAAGRFIELRAQYTQRCAEVVGLSAEIERLRGGI